MPWAKQLAPFAWTQAALVCLLCATAAPAAAAGSQQHIVPTNGSYFGVRLGSLWLCAHTGVSRVSPTCRSVLTSAKTAWLPIHRGLASGRCDPACFADVCRLCRPQSTRSAGQAVYNVFIPIPLDANASVYLQAVLGQIADAGAIAMLTVMPNAGLNAVTVPAVAELAMFIESAQRVSSPALCGPAFGDRLL